MMKRRVEQKVRADELQPRTLNFESRSTRASDGLISPPEEEEEEEEEEPGAYLPQTKQSRSPVNERVRSPNCLVSPTVLPREKRIARCAESRMLAAPGAYVSSRLSPRVPFPL